MPGKKTIWIATICLLLSVAAAAQSGTDTIVLKDVIRDPTSPAAFEELQIPSAGSLMQGFIYKANGKEKHPTVILLHGYPGNERNLDLAQVVRAHGWNVIYFDYRGSWGSQGEFSFEHCVEDVQSVVGFCKEHSEKLKIDTSRLVLFGHSMGGWICLKALQRLPEIKKGFALSTWNISSSVGSKEKNRLKEKEADDYFVLHKKSGAELFKPVADSPERYNLTNDAVALSAKQIIMLDEHSLNAPIAESIRKSNHAYFNYEVWETDHSFTNKRVSLIRKFIEFLDR
jgi:pimeloyl-ACP methyl ester carboxylesterase